MVSTPFKLKSQGSSFKMMGSSPTKDHERDMTTGAIIQHPNESKDNPIAETLAKVAVKGMEKLVNVVKGEESTQGADLVEGKRTKKILKPIPQLKPIDVSGELTKIKETPKSKKTSEPKGTMSKEEVENMPKGA